MNGLKYSFVICDQSTLKDEAHGGPLTDTVLVQILAALTKQLNGEVRDEWGCTATFRIGAADGSDVKPGEIACIILDTLKDAPGAAAYHDKLANGCPVSYYAREDYTSHTKGSNSLSVDLSHECIETIGDPGANRWVDMGTDGTKDKALELCDQVQNLCYEIDGVAVSDFLLQGAFDPGASGPFDHMGQLSSQDDYSNGYMIVRGEDQQSTDEQPSKIESAIAKIKNLVCGTPKSTQRHALGLSRRARRARRAR